MKEPYESLAIVLLVVIVCSISVWFGISIERERLEANCLAKQTGPYPDAVAFCKEQVK